MEHKEKIFREKQMMKHWDEIDSRKDVLIELMLLKREPQPLDFVLFFQCLSIVAEKIEINKEEIIKTPNKIDVENLDEKFKAIFEDLSDQAEKFCDKNVVGEIECLFTSLNDTLPVSDRITAINKIRMTSWKGLFYRKEEISELMERYPRDLKGDDFILIFKCIAMIVLELDIKKQESEILEKLKFI